MVRRHCRLSRSISHTARVYWEPGPKLANKHQTITQMHTRDEEKERMKNRLNGYDHLIGAPYRYVWETTSCIHKLDRLKTNGHMLHYVIPDSWYIIVLSYHALSDVQGHGDIVPQHGLSVCEMWPAPSVYMTF